MRWEECLDKLPRIDSIELEVLTVKSTVKKKDQAVPSQTPKLYLSFLCLKNRNDSTACCPMLNAGNMKSRDDGAARDERSYFLEFSYRRCGSFQVRIISSQAIISFSFVSSSKRRKKKLHNTEGSASLFLCCCSIPSSCRSRNIIQWSSWACFQLELRSNIHCRCEKRTEK